MKNRITRRSRGVAFVLFLTSEDAISCAKNLNNTEVKCNFSYVIIFILTYYFSYITF